MIGTSLTFTVAGQEADQDCEIVSYAGLVLQCLLLLVFLLGIFSGFLGYVSLKYILPDSQWALLWT